MFLKGKKVLVTGADGFIGSHLTELLLRSGADVTALVQYNSFNSWGWIDTFDKELLRSVNVVSGDIREYDGIKKIVKGHEYYYLEVREKGKVRFIYKGKCSNKEIQKYKQAKEYRAKYRKLLSEVKKQIKFLRSTLRGKQPV